MFFNDLKLFRNSMPKFSEIFPRPTTELARFLTNIYIFLHLQYHLNMQKLSKVTVKNTRYLHKFKKPTWTEVFG